MLDNRDQYILILGASVDQIPVYERAKKLGLKTIAIDGNPQSIGFEYCDIPVIFSFKDEGIIDTILKLNKEFRIIGVMTLGIEISPIITKIAEALNLVSVDTSTAYLTTNKCARNMRLDEADINIPDYQIIQSINNLKMELPFIVKPSDSSGSRGVRRVDVKEDIAEAFEQARSHSSDGRVLIEEILEGQQISIEGFMYEGKMHVTGIADRNYDTIPTTNEQPYYIEDGSHSPSLFDNKLVTEMKLMFERACLACGITEGPSKGDLVIVDDEVYVLEITSRLSGGGFCSRNQPLQNGTDIVTATIQWHCDFPVNMDNVTPQFEKAVAHRFYFHKPGRIKSIEGIEAAESMDGVKFLVKQSNFKVGDKLNSVEYINRLLYVVTQADTIEEAVSIANKAIKLIKIKT